MIAAPVRGDAEARRRALDAGTSFLVEAPAGSGKTALLIQRYLALLARVEQPESILAITFTRKAAGEMRGRVISALARAARDEQGTSENDRLTLDLARAAIGRNAQRGWYLLDHPARMRIETIDALCSAVSRRMPWLGGMGGAPAVVEDARELYEEAAENTLRRIAEAGSPARAVEHLLRHLDSDWSQLRRMIEAMLARREQWLRHVVSRGAEPEKLRDLMAENLGRIVESVVRLVRERVPDGTAEELIDLANFAARNGGLDNWAATSELPREVRAWRALADLLLTGTNTPRERVDRRQGFLPGAKWEKARMERLLDQYAEAGEFLETLRQVRVLPEPRYPEPQWRTLEALLVVLPLAVAELKVVFRERGKVDFVEISEAARRALGGPGHPTDLALYLGERYAHVLVDEFQDTSAAQLELIERLIAGWEDGGGQTLFAVGDPMQSIYRFREAEVGIFLRARTHGVGRCGLEPIRLETNFRTRPEIAEWANRAFARVFPSREEAATGAVVFHPSASGREGADGAGVRVHPVVGGDREREASIVADLVERASGSTAILVRARTHAAPIVAELKQRGISYRALELDALKTSPVVSDLMALTRALLHMGDRTAWLAVLRAPWCGLTLAELLDIAGGDTRATIWERLQESTHARVRRVRPILRSALAMIRRTGIRDCIEQTWNALWSEAPPAQGMADARRFLALLEEVDEAGEPSAHVDLERRVAELFAEPDQSADGVVDIMTIHRAKGLEFDHVIVPGLGLGAESDDKPLLRWAEVDTGGESGLVIAPVMAAPGEEDPWFDYLGEIEKKKAEHELARLLYVAATRARESLHLVGHVEVGEDELRTPRRGSLLRLLWPVVEEDFRRAFAERVVPAAATGDATRLSQKIRRVILPGSAGEEVIEAAIEEDDTAAEFSWTGDALRHVGTAVHWWLEEIGREGLEPWNERRVEEQCGRVRAALERLGVLSGDLEWAGRRVIEALRRAVQDPRGRWIMARREGDACEYGASLVEGRAVFHGVIDRTFIEDGERWVIDYKTGVAAEHEIEAECERHRPQLERYARMFAKAEGRRVRAGLYFPLAEVWREIGVG